MENHSARNRARQTMHAEQRLVIQPGEPFDRSIAAHVQGEASEPTESAPVSSQSQVAASPPAQRKRSTTAAKRKPTASFRRAWEVNQQLYAEELQRLEAEAERLNRVLAERAQSTQRSTVLDSEAAGPQNHSATSQARSQSLRLSQAPQTAFSAEDDTVSLQAQADRISQLLLELDAAIRDGGGMPPGNAAPDQENLPRPPLQPPSAGLQAAATDAAQTAETLRYLASRERSRAHPFTPPPPPLHSPRPRSSLRPTARKRLRWQRWLQVPQTSIDRVGDALMWLVAAVMVRVCARILLSAYPVLMPVLVGLMLVPAAIAVYLALCVPRVGMLSFYRLFLVMLGFLLGGKF